MERGSSKPRKIFVLDTNVLIHKPDCILSFKDSDVIVPIWVLEELDKLKTYSDERGRHARHAVRILDAKGRGHLNDGVKIDDGILLKVSTHYERLPNNLSSSKMDNFIVGCALYHSKLKSNLTFFVSKDINARVKARACGLVALDYEKQTVQYDDLYSGFKEIEFSEDRFNSFISKGSVEVDQERLLANQYVIVKSKNREQEVAKFNIEKNSLSCINKKSPNLCGIKPLNDLQRIAIDMLLDTRLDLVTLVGKAGTGKTLLAIAAGLQYIFDKKRYSKLLVSRPIIPMGKDIGFLPGDKNSKLSNWMQPVFDNLEFILQTYNSISSKNQNIKTPETLIKQKFLEVEALTYIRGRSLPNQFIIVDEAQNLSPHEIKTVVSRAGKGTKIVLTGDPDQIDNPYLDANSNGLSYLVDAFKGQKNFGHILLGKSERSYLAEQAAELL